MKVELLLLPRSSGNFQEHLNSVGDSLKQELKKPLGGKIQSWTAGKESTDTVIVIVFQSQGSPAHEFPAALPPELKGSPQGVVVVVIQDDEITCSRRDIVPSDVHLLGVVNVHVVPMQHQLHRQGSSLCARNQQTIKEIVQLLQDSNKNKSRCVQVTSTQQAIKQQGGTVKQEEAKQEYAVSKETKASPPAGSSSNRLELLLLPQTSGPFQGHLSSVGDSLKRELKNFWDVDFQPWTPGNKRPGSSVLIVFQSQGRPGDEFSVALPSELRGGQQRVLVAVVQDDEIVCTGRSIVPSGVKLVSVVSLHVVPQQHTLHVSGTSLCPRNMESIQKIAEDLGLKSKQWLSGTDWWKPGSVYIHSLLQHHNEAIMESIVKNLENKGKTVVPSLDRANPSALLLLCRPEDAADGKKLEETLQDLLPNPLTHKSKTIVAIIQEKSGEGELDKLEGFAQVHCLTVQPPSYRLVKNDDNGRALSQTARFLEELDSLASS